MDMLKLQNFCTNNKNLKNQRQLMLLPLQKVIFRLNYYSQGKASKMA